MTLIIPVRKKGPDIMYLELIKLVSYIINKDPWQDR